MKSDLFKSGHFFDDDDKKGILTFCELTDSEFNQYLDWYSTKIKEKAPRKPDDLLPLARESKFSAKEIINALSVCFYIIYFCFDHKDNIEYITDDLIESGIIKNECKDAFLQRFDIAYKSFESGIKDFYVQESTTNFTNRLLSFIFKCEIIPKFESEFKTNIEGYKPKIDNLYPVTKLIFGYENDFGYKKSVSFYVSDDKGIDDLIDNLLAVKIKLNEIKKLVSSVKSQSL